MVYQMKSSKLCIGLSKIYLSLDGRGREKGNILQVIKQKQMKYIVNV
jgi:hypothetical protein